MIQRPVYIAAILTTVFLGVHDATAQEFPGRPDSLYSNILNEKRMLRVVLPDNYKPGSPNTYDVLYVLDGGSNIKTAYDVERYLEDEEQLPPMIIVSIGNVDRNQDFTPTHMVDFRTFGGQPNTTGGAKNFLSFVQNELIPYIDRAYPSNKKNTLFGHSFGGLFAMYVYLKRPELFESYILADPSFWYDNDTIVKVATEKLPVSPATKTLWISESSDDAVTPKMGIAAMDSVLESKAPAGLRWKKVFYPGETHSSIRLLSMYDGLKFTYAGYPHYQYRTQFHTMPMNGWVVNGKPYAIRYYPKLEESIRYTTDGTEPTVASPIMKHEVTLTSPSMFTLKSFASQKRYDVIARGTFSAGSVLSAEAKPKTMKAGGFHFSYYEGEWGNLSDVRIAKPILTGRTDSSFDMNGFPRKKNYAFVIEGYLETTEPGYYYFFVETGSALRLSVGGRTLIDHNSSSEYSPYESCIAPLQKGFYPFRLEILQQKGNVAPDFKYQTPDSNGINRAGAISIPSALQFGWE